MSGLGGYAGQVVGKGSNYASKIGTGVTNWVGVTNPNAAKDAAKAQADEQAGYTQELGTIKQMGDVGTTYANAVNKNVGAANQAINNYTGTYDAYQSQILNQTKNQATNANASYTNTILPAQKDLMDQSINNAKGAMTLQQAMDPNNAVASGTRQLYNTTAQGIQNQGTADYGVLAALGGQATANTIGASGQPLTGGQMQAMQGANMGQASNAFANAQAQANSLKQQGLQAGTNQSNLMYQYGQNANTAAQNAVGQYAGLENQNLGLQQGYLQQESGLSGNMYNANAAAQGQIFNNNNLGAQTTAGVNTNYLQNMLAAETGQTNSIMGFDASKTQADNAAAAGKTGMVGAVVGGVAGGVIGGPAGAAAGASLGHSAGAGLAQQGTVYGGGQQAQYAGMGNSGGGGGGVSIGAGALPTSWPSFGGNNTAEVSPEQANGGQYMGPGSPNANYPSPYADPNTGPGTFGYMGGVQSGMAS